MAGPSARVIRIDFQVDDDPASVQTFLDRLLDENGALHADRIDLRHAGYVGPHAAAVLFALARRRGATGPRLEVDLPDNPPALEAFCSFSGLAAEFAGGPPPERDHPQNETIPCRTFAKATFNEVHDVVELIRRHQPDLDDDAEQNLRVSLQEAMQNIVDHAQSPFGGALCARYLNGHQEVRFAVVDCGLGVRATLRRTHPEATSDRIALDLVSKGHNSSKSRPTNAGLGVSNFLGIAREIGGSLLFVSGTASVVVRGGRGGTTAETHRWSFPGTAIFANFPTASPATP